MKAEITVLIENYPETGSGLKAEHGLSFYIEAGDKSILFDTGETGKFTANAEALGKDLSKVSDVIISHGHSDHSGGFRKLCEITTDFTLYTGKGFLDGKYVFRDNKLKYIGNDFDSAFLAEQGITHRKIASGAVEIAPDIFVVSGFKRTNDIEKISSEFILEKDFDRIDRFADEALLVLRQDDGLTVIVGCSHAGIMNIVDYIKTLFDEPVKTIIGGTHLVAGDSSRLDKTVEYFADNGIGNLGLCHCTGDHARKVLAERCPGYREIHSGTRLTI